MHGHIHITYKLKLWHDFLIVQNGPLFVTPLYHILHVCKFKTAPVFYETCLHNLSLNLQNMRK